MSNISWRHHYIPKFYLNEFTNNSGSFKIYDVEIKQFLKDGKDFSPRAYFFEENANTMTISRTKESNDSLEQWYAKIDDDISNIYTKIRTLGNESLVDLDIAKIEYFIGLLYWRIPTNFDKVCQLVKTKKLHELGMVVTDKDGNLIEDIELEKEFKGEEISAFTKFVKLYYPIIGYAENTMRDIPVNVLTFIGDLPSVCSDNPLLILNPTDFRVYRDEYIFPINNKLVFFRGKTKPFLNTLKYEIDILTIKQAKKYVSCTDMDYMDFLENIFQEKYKSIEKLRNYLFNEIFILN